MRTQHDMTKLCGGKLTYLQESHAPGEREVGPNIERSGTPDCYLKMQIKRLIEYRRY